MSTFPIGERLLSDLASCDRARLAILAETHAGRVYTASNDVRTAAASTDGLDSDRPSWAGLYDAAAAVANAWGGQAPAGLGAQDVTSLAGAYLNEHLDLLTLTDEECAQRAQRRSQEILELEVAALAAAKDGGYARAAGLLERLLDLDPDRLLRGGRSVAATRDALRLRATDGGRASLLTS